MAPRVSKGSLEIFSKYLNLQLIYHIVWISANICNFKENKNWECTWYRWNQTCHQTSTNRKMWICQNWRIWKPQKYGYQKYTLYSYKKNRRNYQNLLWPQNSFLILSQINHTFCTCLKHPEHHPLIPWTQDNVHEDWTVVVLISSVCLS